MFANRCWADNADDRPTFTAAITELQSIKLKTPSYAESYFKKVYDATPAPWFAHNLLDAVQQLLAAYCKLHGLPEATGVRFFRDLEKEAFRNPNELLAEVPFAAQRMWTSAEKLGKSPRGHRLNDIPDAHNLELCSILNAVIRDDEPTLVPHVAIVARGNAVAPPGPALSRGGGFDNAHQDFFTVGKWYQVPGFLATSSSGHTLHHFINQAFTNRGRPVIVWNIQLDPLGATDSAHRCSNVSEVTWTNVDGEAEFLFKEYSPFRVDKVKWAAGTDTDPHVVHLWVATQPLPEHEALPLEPLY